MALYYHDIEVSKNYFSDIFVDIKTNSTLIDEYIKADIAGDEETKHNLANQFAKVYVIHETRNDIRELYSFIKRNVTCLIGFNGLHYDDVILKYLMLLYERNETDINEKLYKLNNLIIDLKKGEFNEFLYKLKQYPEYWETIDPFQIVFTPTKRKGLKQTLINLNWYKIEDLPFIPGYLVKPQDIPTILDYELNDILGLRHLFLNKKDEIIDRINCSNLYGIDVRNKSRSGVADAMIAKFYIELNPDVTIKDLHSDEFRTYRDWISIGECIDPRLTFGNYPIIVKKNYALANRKDDFRTLSNINTLSELKNVLSNLKVRGTNEIKYRIYIKDTVIDIKSGGLHSVDTPNSYAEDEHVLLDADVDSFYLNVMIENNALPEHLNRNFMNKIISWTKDRITAKHSGNKVVSENLKTTLVSIFGKTKSNDSPLYDPKATLTITISGQLSLLMLIEQLVSRIPTLSVISVNTDGILCTVPRNEIINYYNICTEWSEYLSYNLEYNEYSLYVRKDVNNYYAILKDGKVKTKGIFAWDDSDITKGSSISIIPIALRNYFTYKIPIEETIKNNTEIYNFCMSQKIGGNFFPILMSTKGGIPITVKLQTTNRFYVSKSGGYLFKDYKPVYNYETEGFTKAVGKLTINKKGKEVRKVKNPMAILKNTKITILNKLNSIDNFSKYNVDYDYYIKICNELKDKIEHSNIIEYYSLFDSLIDNVINVEEIEQNEQFKEETWTIPNFE